MSDDLRSYVQLVLEGKAKHDVQVSNGTIVPFGSQAHINDLEKRISSLKMWRDASQRGSERRANYARLMNQLKGELRAALRIKASQAPPQSTSL